MERLRSSLFERLVTPGLMIIGGIAPLGLLLYYSSGAKKNEKGSRDLPFSNGVSFTFLLKVLYQGASFDVIFRMLSFQNRKRIYVANKKWLFWGDETWWVGHPSIVAQVFSHRNIRLWRKLTKDEVFSLFYLSNPDKGKQNAMLYTGDDDGWRHIRTALTPFFYTHDMSEYDNVMDATVASHLKEAASTQHPVELISTTLKITVDLLCRILYSCELSKDDLSKLTSALAEYIVPSAASKTYDGLDCFEYHKKVAEDMGRKAPEGTLAHIILHDDIPGLAPELRNANLAFLLEALTPAFASYWTVCNILQSIDVNTREKAKNDAVFRQQCIKESLRMYPPVPMLWPREALVDQEIINPVFDGTRPPRKTGFLSSMLFGKPFEEQPTIKIKKGTKVVVLPGILHYDDRFWVRPTEFLPERWDTEPNILAQGNAAQIETRKRVSHAAGLSVRKSVMEKQGFKSPSSSRVRHEVSESSVRAQVLGVEHEKFCADVASDHLFECTTPQHDAMLAWTFLPFGLGQHTCLGRRLAIRMVDSIVSMCLEYDAQFYQGVIPSLLTRKSWHQRTSSKNAAYNFPADPVYIRFEEPKKKASGGVYRSSMSFMTWDNQLDRFGRLSVAGYGVTGSQRNIKANMLEAISTLMEEDEDFDDDDDDGDNDDVGDRVIGTLMEEEEDEEDEDDDEEGYLIGA